MKIYAPNIHLFAFELYKAVNFHEALNVEDVVLWKNADNIIKNTLNQDLQLSKYIDLQKESENARVDLIKDSEVIDGDYSIPIQGNLSQITIKGFAYPLRIYDSYGLWLNLRRPEKKDDGTATESLDTSIFNKFNLNNCFTLPQHPLLLGQTLLITG